MSALKQQCTLTQGEVMVSAHLMSIQIDDGSPGDAFHSVEQKLRGEWENVCSLSEGDRYRFFTRGSKVKPLALIYLSLTRNVKIIRLFCLKGTESLTYSYFYGA